MKTARFGAFIKYLEITALRITKKTDKRFKTGMAWSQAEVELLIKLYPISYNTDLAIRFNRSQEAIRGKARKLGLAKDYAGGYQRLWGIGQPWSRTEINLLRELYATYTPNEKMAEKLGLVKMEFWSESEDQLLKKLYKKLTYEQLAKRLGRTLSAVNAKTRALGLELKKPENWTQDEVDFLKKSYVDTNFAVIAEKLGRSHYAVCLKTRKMGLVRQSCWTEADDAELKRLYPEHTVNEISQILGRTYNAVEGRAWHLRLFKFTHWTEEGIQKLKELYPEFSASQVAEKTGYSLNAIQHKVRQLGLCTKKRGAKEGRRIVNNAAVAVM
ncbi:MAG: hypothetical protein J7L73_07990 [Anaerolineales bacterium]|nr:hypothetical protein [Anaerolineales bacterium]